MSPVQAALPGAMTGLLFGLFICLIRDIPVADCLFRIGVLAAAGAWMGVLLAWLNELLPDRLDSDAIEAEHKEMRR
ncbi:MAG: hypothetical protein R8K47_06260 [Mariprofundaceae bacterium]